MKYDDWLEQKRQRTRLALEQTAMPIDEAKVRKTADEVFQQSINRQRQKLAKLRQQR